jgi:hypothetical protein
MKRLLTVALFAIFIISNHAVAKNFTSNNLTLKIGKTYVDAKWVTPTDETPKAWVLLQHGFMRRLENLTDLADSWAEAGYAVLLTTIPSQTLHSAGFINDFAEYIQNDLPKPEISDFPSRFILTGHSLGGQFISRVSAKLVRDENIDLVGTILLDPVNNGNEIKIALKVLNGKSPVFVILTPPSNCNSHNSVRESLEELDKTFIGINLTRSTHCVFEGASTNWMCEATCGKTPRDVVELSKSFTTNWLDILMFGSTDQSINYLPGGKIFEELLLESQIGLL